MRILLLILSVICISLFVAGGIYSFTGDELMQEKATGYATLILFIVIMPLFLFWRYQVRMEKKKEEEKDNNL